MNQLVKLRIKLSEAGLDGAIIFDELNQRYLTRFAFSDGFLLITKSKAYLVTDFRYLEMAKKSVCADFEVVTPVNRREFMHSVIKEEEIRLLGFEGETVSFAKFSRLKEDYPEVELCDIGDMVENMRQVKPDWEIELIGKSQEITDLAFSGLLSQIKPDMTEIEVAAELEYLMKRLGSEGTAFDTIAVSGDSSTLPHGVPRNCKLKKGFLTLDFGAKYGGYCSDMTRTIVIGRADSEMKELYNTVLAAQRSALEFLRAGADCGEADKAARDVIEAKAEYKGAFGHSLGHSVGLFIHESPSLSPKAFGKKLKAGNVVTVEPGIYLYGRYGCRIEDMVKIVEGGIQNFTKSTKELIEIC
ncbi:MAG: aminopeptidase P family protein [Clostridia bacterium]|nr:aminopeptidase P family protein [Clostridia bacterium]